MAPAVTSAIVYANTPVPVPPVVERVTNCCENGAVPFLLVGEIVKTIGV